MHSNIPLRIRFTYFSGRGMKKYGKSRLNLAQNLVAVVVRLKHFKDKHFNWSRVGSSRVHFNKCVFHIFHMQQSQSNYYQIRMLAETAVTAALLPTVTAVAGQSWCHQEDLLLCFADATDNAAVSSH